MSGDGSVVAIHTWAFGHTHFNVDMVLDQVRVVCNQRCYKYHLAVGHREDVVLRVPERWPPSVAASANTVSSSRCSRIPCQIS